MAPRSFGARELRALGLGHLVKQKDKVETMSRGEVDAVLEGLSGICALLESDTAVLPKASEVCEHIDTIVHHLKDLADHQEVEQEAERITRKFLNKVAMEHGTGRESIVLWCDIVRLNEALKYRY